MVHLNLDIFIVIVMGKNYPIMYTNQSIAWLGTVDSDGGNGDTNLATCNHTAW